MLEDGAQVGDVVLEDGAQLGDVVLGGGVFAEPTLDSPDDGLGHCRLDAGVLKLFDGFVGIEKNRGHERDDAPRASWSSIRQGFVGFAVVSGKAVRGWAGAVLVGGGVLAWSSVAFAQDAAEDGCPRAALRQMMSVGARHDAIADVAALELEVLELCVERQGLIVQIVEGNRELAGFRGSRPEGATGSGALTEPGGVALPPPAKAAGAEVVEDRPEQWEEREEAPVRAPAQEPVVRRPRLSWLTVYGSAGEWVAGVSDGAKVWYVRAGDVLPSGVRVVWVRVRPAGVAVRHEGEEWQIPGPSGG